MALGAAVMAEDAVPLPNPTHGLVTCVVCQRGATFTADAVCRLCRHKRTQERPTADEVRR